MFGSDGARKCIDWRLQSRCQREHVHNETYHAPHQPSGQLFEALRKHSFPPNTLGRSITTWIRGSHIAIASWAMTSLKSALHQIRVAPGRPLTRLRSPLRTTTLRSTTVGTPTLLQARVVNVNDVVNQGTAAPSPSHSLPAARRPTPRKWCAVPDSGSRRR